MESNIFPTLNFLFKKVETKILKEISNSYYSIYLYVISYFEHALFYWFLVNVSPMDLKTIFFIEKKNPANSGIMQLDWILKGIHKSGHQAISFGHRFIVCGKRNSKTWRSAHNFVRVDICFFYINNSKIK